MGGDTWHMIHDKREIYSWIGGGGMEWGFFSQKGHWVQGKNETGKVGEGGMGNGRE